MNGSGKKDMETDTRDVSGTIERVLSEYGVTGPSTEARSSLGCLKYSAKLPESFNTEAYFDLCDSLRREIGERAADVTVSEDREICILVFPGDNSYTGAGISTDELLRRAAAISVMTGGASASLLQRRLDIGYVVATDLMRSLAEQGIISSPSGGYGEVKICESEFYERFGK